MKKNIFSKVKKTIHFIGIGGISMSALAKYCLEFGFSVSGSDRKINEQTELLKKLGAKINIGHSSKNVMGADYVCYSSAIENSNPEYLFALENEIPLIKRSQLLGQIAKLHKTTIAVCGSHGKTTTTAMISRILSLAKLNPTVFLGGKDKKIDNFHKGNKGYCVLEACEYKKNFLDILPNISVVTNIDNDHLDSYESLEEQIDCVNKFVEGSICVVNIDDEKAKKVKNQLKISIGIDNEAAFVAKNIKTRLEKQSFSVYAYGKRLGRIKLSLKGKHNIYNSLCAIAVASQCKIPFIFIKKGLEDFEGVERRDEYIGKLFERSTYCDYAHHPSEIRSYLSSRDELEKTLVIFQPHTFTRTKFLMNEFLDVFLDVKCGLLIYKTYPAREKYLKTGSAKMLYDNLKGRENTYYEKSRKGLFERIKELSQYDKILVVGAGDIYDIVKRKVKKI